MTGGERTYPLPEMTEDPRFSMGLLTDVVDVLARHHYPVVSHPHDLVALQSTLFRFLYVGEQ